MAVKTTVSASCDVVGCDVSDDTLEYIQQVPKGWIVTLLVDADGRETRELICDAHGIPKTNGVVAREEAVKAAEKAAQEAAEAVKKKEEAAQ